MAQIGFIVHQIALLEPKIGRANAGFAVSVMTFMAIAGRLGLGMVIDRFDPRRVTAVAVVSQAAALLIIMHFDTVPVVLAACAVFGFSVGNLITLPPLIMHREFSSASFVVVMGLSNAISGTIGSLGPAFIGLVRSWSGGAPAELQRHGGPCDHRPPRPGGERVSAVRRCAHRELARPGNPPRRRRRGHCSHAW